MKKKLALIMILIFTIANIAFADEYSAPKGKIKGIISPASSGAKISLIKMDSIIPDSDIPSSISPSADGSFTIDAYAGDYIITVSAEGYLTVSLSSVLVKPKQTTDVGTITLKKAGAINGVIITGEKDSVLIGALKRDRVGGWISFPKFSAVNKKDNTYTIDQLDEGLYDIIILSSSAGIYQAVSDYGGEASSEGKLADALREQFVKITELEKVSEVEDQLIMYSKDYMSSEGGFDALKNRLDFEISERKQENAKLDIEYSLLACAGNEDRAVSIVKKTRSITTEDSEKKTQQDLIYFWIKEKGEWKIAGISNPFPSIIAKDIWKQNMQNQPEPASFDVKIIFNSQLSGIEVKENETSKVNDFAISRLAAYPSFWVNASKSNGETAQ
ncbi:MAG: carboxypeptidase-like regulatory domain-containing protein [Armatimonadota bacterium]